MSTGKKLDASRGRAYFVAEEAARDVDFLATNDNDFLAGENLLRNYGGQPTKEVTLAIDDDGCRREGGHGSLWALRNKIDRQGVVLP
jgi:hypothetical protein